jgi:hypothetical protein
MNGLSLIIHDDLIYSQRERESEERKIIKEHSLEPKRGGDL